MEEIIAIASITLKWLVMKKDSDLPWATRIARWLGVLLLLGFVGHCFKEWFL